MDGNQDIAEQVKLMRSVIGRKIMEIDEFNTKAENMVGDEAGKYVDLVDFLNHDIAGYKTIIEDLRDGSCDYTGNLWDIASLPAESVGLYTDFYLPALSECDRADEEAAMHLKGTYAQDLAKGYTMKLGRTALTSQMAINLMMADDSIAMAIGMAVAGNPEIMDALKSELESQQAQQ